VAGYCCWSRSATTVIWARASSSEAPGARPADHREIPVGPLPCRIRVERERRPHLRAHREVESLRRDADDFVGLGVERDRPSDDGGIAAEAPVPEPMADDGAAMAAGGFLVCQEPAAERRLHAERREEIRGHAEALHPLRLVPANQVHVPPGERRHALNAVALALPVEEIRRRHRFAAVLGIAGTVGQQQDPVHLREGERPDDQGVDHRQDGGVRTEPERERQHDQAGKPGALQVCSQRIFHVEAEGAHQGISSRN
jgi:hypothetical protein